MRPKTVNFSVIGLVVDNLNVKGLKTTTMKKAKRNIKAFLK